MTFGNILDAAGELIGQVERLAETVEERVQDAGDVAGGFLSRLFGGPARDAARAAAEPLSAEIARSLAPLIIGSAVIVGGAIVFVSIRKR